ncbi:MAG: hypothetical protein ABJN35_14860 [Erythrobacter sp.]
MRKRGRREFSADWYYLQTVKLASSYQMNGNGFVPHQTAELLSLTQASADPYKKPSAINVVAARVGV